MYIFFEEWASQLEPNRQLTADLEELKIMAFCRVDFTHHREILRKCKTADERWYYIVRCANEFWSVSALKSHLRSNNYASFGNIFSDNS